MTDFPSHWEVLTLADVAKWGSGGTPKATEKQYYGGAIPWAVIGDLNDALVTECASSITDRGLQESSAKMIPQGAVLIAMYGSIGKLGIAGVPMASNQAIAFAVPNEKVSARYLFWYLRSQRTSLVNAGKGATQQNISQTVLKAWPIPTPSIVEQSLIVEAIEEQFSRLDDAESSLNRAVRNLTRLRREAFNRTKSGGYPQVSLSQVADVVSGQTPKGLSTEGSGEIPFYKVGDMNTAQGYGMAAAREYLSAEGARSCRLTVRPAGTVVFPKRGGAIATNKKRVLKAPAAFDLNTMGIVPSNKLDSMFLLYWLETIDLAELSDGSNVPQINHDDVTPLLISVPPLPEQRTVVAEIERQLSMLDSASLASRRALGKSQQLRRSILEAAFGGKLTKLNIESTCSVPIQAVAHSDNSSERSPVGVARSVL